MIRVPGPNQIISTQGNIKTIIEVQNISQGGDIHAEQIIQEKSDEINKILMELKGLKTQITKENHPQVVQTLNAQYTIRYQDALNKMNQIESYKQDQIMLKGQPITLAQHQAKKNTVNCMTTSTPKLEQNQKPELIQPGQQPPHAHGQQVKAGQQFDNWFNMQHTQKPQKKERIEQRPNQQQVQFCQQVPERKQSNNQLLKDLDPALIKRIENEIIDSASQTTGWDRIAGLNNVRSQIEEVAIWPLMNPGLFEGITQPGRGLLLFGPPGTGKTMIGKAIANQAKATFFSISASSLTSKWVGEAEQLVKTLFILASIKQPSVIFIDEIDSLLCARSDKDTQASRSIKTEFMVQLEGASRNGNDRVVFIGATNRPQELDDAIRRRFQKRLYIPLPNYDGRTAQFKIILDSENAKGKLSNLSTDVSTTNFYQFFRISKGYSGADVKNLCTEAFFIPIRQAVRVDNIDIKNLKAMNIRAVNMEDFKQALKSVKPTVMQKDLQGYFDWNKEFGTFNFTQQELNS